MQRALHAQYMAAFLNNVASTTAAAILAILLLGQNVPGLWKDESVRGKNLLEIMGPEGLHPVIFAIGMCITAVGWGHWLMVAAKLDEESIENFSLRDDADRAMLGSWAWALLTGWMFYRLWTDILTRPLGITP